MLWYAGKAGIQATAEGWWDAGSLGTEKDQFWEPRVGTTCVWGNRGVSEVFQVSHGYIRECQTKALREEKFLVPPNSD